jgi:solute:Na+ symporter, SSS family
MTSPILANTEVLGGYLPHLLMATYMVFLVVLCIVGYLKGKATEEDYYLAGRGQGTLVTSLTIMATFFSSAALLGIPGTIYRDGVSFVPFALNLTVGGLGIYFLGTRMHLLGKARGYVTPADMLSDYYGGNAVRLLAALTGALYVLPYIIMQIKAGGYLAEQLFGRENSIRILGSEYAMFEIGVWALSLLTMLYVLVGGMRSVAWTDVVQGILLLSGMLVAGLATIIYFQAKGGYFQALTTLPPEALTIPGASGKWNPWMMFTICVFAALGSIIQPGQWMRFYAARSVKTLRQSAIVFSILLPICFIFGIMIVALGARVEFPPEKAFPPKKAEAAEEWQSNKQYKADDTIFKEKKLYEAKTEKLSADQFDESSWSEIKKDLYISHESLGPKLIETDNAVIVMAEHTVPQVFGTTLGSLIVTLILIAVMAASMSTADSNLHALSAVLTRDVYDRHIRPQASEKEKTWFGRAVIIAATVAAVALVEISQKSSSFDPLKLITQLMFLAIAFSSQLLPLAIDSLFIHKGTRQGAVAGISFGILVVLVFSPLRDILLSEDAAASLGAFTDTLQQTIHISAIGILSNTLVFAIVSRFTEKIPQKRIDEFRRIMKGKE